MKDQSTINEIIRFLESNESKLGALSTIGDDAPQVAFVYFAVDKDLNIYFLTKADTGKYKNIMKNPMVAFAVASENPAGTVQLKGKAEVVTDADLQRDLFPKIIEHAKSRTGFPPIEQYSKTGEAMFFKVTPTWARFFDFEVEDKTQIFHEVTFT